MTALCISGSNPSLLTLINYRDLEPLITQHKKDLVKNNYIHRMIAFSLSGTYMVDLKDMTQQGRLASKLQPDFLSNFFANMIKIQYLSPGEHNGHYGHPREEFMKTLSLELFNFSVCTLTHPLTNPLDKHSVQPGVRGGYHGLEAGRRQFASHHHALLLLSAVV